MISFVGYKKNLLVYLISLILLLGSGCSKRYWFRIKVPGKVESKHSISVNVINLSPEYLDSNFQVAYTQNVYQSLKKYGFVQALKNPSEYTFTIVMSVENYEKKGTSYVIMGNTKNPRLTEVASERPPVYKWKDYENAFSTLDYKYALVYNLTKSTVWSRGDYVYRKSNEKSNVKRSISILKLALRKKGEE